jgi:undecaprenyl-diphosphatase
VGTFNHFATDVGITSIARTVRALRAGQAVAVDLARANQWMFLNTASLGAYPRLVSVRRRWEPRVGKWAALGISLGAALPGTQPLRLHLDGSTERVWLLFVGNCLYQPAGLAPAFRTDLHDGLLDVRLLRHRSRENPRRLGAAALIRRVYSGDRFHAAAYDRLTVDLGGQAAPLALDGEIVAEVHNVVFSKSPRPLLVYRPMDRPVRTTP